MNDLADFECSKQKIESINKSIVRILKIRTNIVIKRNEAITYYHHLDHSDKEKAIKILSSCLWKERKILKVLEKHLKNAIGILLKLLKDMKEIRIKKDYIDNAKLMLWVLEYTLNKMDKIRERVKEEELFLETRKFKYFKKFEKSWKKEIKYDRKIAKKLNPAELNKLKNSIVKLSKCTGGGIFAGTAGATWGASGGGSIIQLRGNLF